MAFGSSFRLIASLEQEHDQHTQTTPAFTPLTFAQALDLLREVQHIEFSTRDRPQQCGLVLCSGVEILIVG